MSGAFSRKAVLLAVVPILAACGGDSPDDADDAAPPAAGAPAAPVAAPAAAPARDVCTMLTVDEVNAASGVSGACQPSTSGDAQVGTWMGDGGRTAIVQVYSSASSYESARGAFESLYKGTAANVSGLGEQAFYIGGSTGRFPTATVTALRGGTPVSVQVMAMDGEPAALRPSAEALTRAVLEKLQ